VVFAAQKDISKIPPAADPPTSPNPLTNSFGGWQAVENASLAIAESARLLTVPGRICSNGKAAPIARPDFIKFTQGMRTAALETYKAAQKKSTDAMADAAGDLTDACQMCHDVYRKGDAGAATRCSP